MADNMVSYALAHRDIQTIKPGVLTVAAFDKFYPIAFFEKGLLDGIEVRMMREYAAKIGMEVKFIRVKKWDGIWDLPRLKEADISIGGIANSYRREHKDTEWSMPYYYVNRSAITLKTHKGFIASVAAIEGSTGYMDAKFRAGELMGTLKRGLGKNRDLTRLRKKTLHGIMYGDQVSKSVIKSQKKKDLKMNTWSIVPTLVPRDGETFSFPTRLGSGIAVSLTAFLVEAAENGLLKKLCKKFSLQYPIYPTDKTFVNEKIMGKKPTVFKEVLTNFLTAPEYEKIRKRLSDTFKTVKNSYKFTNVNVTHEREYHALERPDIVDTQLILGEIELPMAMVSSLITSKYMPYKGAVLGNRKKDNFYCYNCDDYEGRPSGDTSWFEYIDYMASKGEDTPLVHYYDDVAHINCKKFMENVRANGNTYNALTKEYLHVGKQLLVQVLEAETGVKNVKKILKIEYTKN